MRAARLKAETHSEIQRVLTGSASRSTFCLKSFARSTAMMTLSTARGRLQLSTAQHSPEQEVDGQAQREFRGQAWEWNEGRAVAWGRNWVNSNGGAAEPFHLTL